MAAAVILPGLISTLTDSVDSASSSLLESTSLAPFAEGISLLDTKNELLLSYLQNLIFLIILKIRQHASLSNGDGYLTSESLNDEVTKKLIELRVYLEKGVRPLEGRLKYQLDKLLLAASEAESPPVTHGTTNGTSKSRTIVDGDSDIDDTPTPMIPELSHRPNPASFARPSQSERSTTEDKSGPYRPPRITPTALPTTERKAAKAVKPRKLQTLDAFIREEMDDAPMAEPSIGAGSGLKGKAREEEEERKGFEEQRLVRLPGEKKKKGRRRMDEDISGGLAAIGDIDFGDLKGVKRRKMKESGRDGFEGKWEKRVNREKKKRQ